MTMRGNVLVGLQERASMPPYASEKAAKPRLRCIGQRAAEGVPRKREICIYIGGYHAGKEPTVIHTVLGSCVAVCLLDPASRIGGMNHILLPGRADMKHFDCSARYGINAMELLINRIMRLGGRRENLVAKIFGGAHLLPSISLENGTGRKNVEFVQEFLRLESIETVSMDVGGTQYRKILLHTDTGEVLLKRGKSSQAFNLAAIENNSLESVRKTSKYPGKITLF